MNFSSKLLLIAASAVIALPAADASAQVPLVGPGEIVLAKLHGEGAQLYQCKPDTGRSSSPGPALTWHFLEPVATLFMDGKPVGRHYAGPNWDHIDGSGVKGKVLASAPGATANDIQWLKLEASELRGRGALSGATAVLRVDTRGGQAPPESCGHEGEYLSVAYSAEYVFLRKGE